VLLLSREITETTATDAADSERSPPTAADCEAGRLLMGAMRVGPLLKCVLLRGDIAEHLVVVCSEKPTRSLLQNIVNQLSAVLEVRESCTGPLEMHLQSIAIFIQLIILAISIAPLQVHCYSEALPTQHGYCVGVSCRSATGNCE